MYKYFKELENPDGFKIYLKDNYEILRNSKKYYKSLSFDFVIENKDLFSKLRELDKIILGHNEKFGYPLFMDGNKRWVLCNIYYYLEDLRIEREECGLKEINMVTNTNELIRKLEEYEVYCNSFMDLYSDLKLYFQDIKSSIESALEKLVTYIKLPPKNTIVEYLVPNGFYITKSGFLYNPNGEVGDYLKGHKEGNLKYSFDRIRDSICSNKNIETPYYDNNVTYKEHLEEIIKNGCVNENDFQIYANLVLDFNAIVTEKWLKHEHFFDGGLRLPDREVVFIIVGDKKIGVERKNQEKEEFKKWLKTPQEIKTSYQPNINTLVQGYFAAVIDVYKAFARLNPSTKKREHLEKIYSFSWDYSDILIRFCGFHKVETCEKKITTSSLYGVDLFKEYLERGFDLYILPPIIYDAYLDDVAELDFRSYYVDKHFDKVLSEYEGKGRVLVRNINC